MALYAVGDLQGCLDPLKRLLDRVDFDPAQDRLWLVGDLVNRGPESLACLRFVRNLGDAAVSVLGNHDLHLLAIHAGLHKPRRKDTVQSILDSPDREELMEWLRHRPVLHHDASLGWTMVHAGLPPQWDLETALACADELHQVLRGPEHTRLLQRMYGDQPDRWDPALTGWSRLRFITNSFTRMRYCTRDGRLDMDYKGAPGKQPAHLVPWHAVEGRLTRDHRLVVGHWSTLGYRFEHNVLSLDTGCIWGGKMTLARLDTPEPEVSQLRCPTHQPPG
ncbi:symmetrical bis(5'-nucleosyl)-tetraphosphatase [Ectothiorhodospira variabilis]|uniref:symmetrical bis(5'-nucleosyl)-tetraphosphatase n=1 Tax=Ectothiorhodospira variabilis TaxID=505694 RepID=UPI001EFBE4F1|nr:symmetrical bis(5'-nucleosyl)-tetraphosphatase [Ectothiorhodospira variabilis]MCG5498887.1 symmetrical bis(5'-nucleosyl)-tetraphosphatase [Ectothiorhodospira variabilis]